MTPEEFARFQDEEWRRIARRHYTDKSHGRPGNHPASGWKFARAFVYSEAEYRILENVHNGARVALARPAGATARFELVEYSRSPQVLDIEKDFNQYMRDRRRDAEAYTERMPEATRRDYRRQFASKARA